MSRRSLTSFRLALLSSLGLLHACGARSMIDAERTDEIDGMSDGEDPVSNQPRPGPTDPTGTPTPVQTAPTTAPTAPLGPTTPIPPVTPSTTPTAPIVTPTTPPTTTLPEPMLESVCAGPDADTGVNLRQCSNGITHRYASTACKSIYPRPDSVVPEQLEPEQLELAPLPPPMDAGVGGAPNPPVSSGGASNPPVTNDFSACTRDADCVELPNGICNLTGSKEWGMYTYCTYGCITDDDCENGAVCECGEDIGQCVSATCRVDSDCAPGHVCARFAFETGCGVEVNYACTTDADECRSNVDCGVEGPGPGGCQPSWTAEQPGAACSGISCVEGRPFIVHGEARVAAAVERADWTAPVAASVELDGATCKRLAAHWTSIGQMEHASIAAFGRFSLQLLALGAPPELLEATHRALADETLHARLAFALATRYAGTPIGPGPLALDGALDRVDLESVTVDTLLEGCIGETFAAMEARAALEGCTDAGVRAVLQRIVRDESQHAELAWRFVQWALQRAPELGPTLQQVALDKLAAARRVSAELRGDVTEDTAGLARYGVTSERLRAELQVDVLCDVVLPCLHELRAASKAA